MSVVDQASGLAPRRYGRSRQALVDATIVLSARVGFHGVTVAELSVMAGLGPRTFYNHFADLSDVFFEACWGIHEDLRRTVRVAYDGAGVERREDTTAAGDGVVRGRAAACVEAVVAFVQADPARARVLFVEGYAGGPAVAGLRAETVEWLVGLVVGQAGHCGVRGRSGAADGPADGGDRPVGSGRARLPAEFAVGGINGVVRTRIVAGDLAGLTDLIPSFVDTLRGVHGGHSRRSVVW